MRRIITILTALMLSFTWASAQKLVYDQMGDLTSELYGFNSCQGTGWQAQTGYGADDFDVTAAGMDIYGSMAVFHRGDFESVQVFIYADDNGKPNDTPIETFKGLSYEVTELAYEVYQYKVEFPYKVSLTEGKYWFTMAGFGQWMSGKWYLLNNATDIGAKAQHKQVTDMMGWLDPAAEWKEVTEDDPFGSVANGNGTYNNLVFGLIGAPDPNDLALKEIIAPISGELTSETEFIVTVQNAGIDVQTSFDVMYQVSKTVDGILELVETSTETVTVNIDYKEVVEYTFTKTADLSELITYSIKVAVILTGDTNYDNDIAYSEAKNFGPLYIMGTDTIVTACDGIFVDDGSVTGTYTQASSDTITFYPGVEGNRVEIDFTMMEIGNDISVFDFYDGDSTDATKLYKYVRYSGDYPSYVKARNADGAITVVVKLSTPWNYPGWMANISCINADAIDFMALDMAVGNPGDFNVVDKPVDVMAIVTNTGADTTSRAVYLIENNIVVDTLMTANLIPGVIDTLHFNWIPSVASTDMALKVQIENDPQDTNGDNALGANEAVFKNGILLESFEADFGSGYEAELPLEWISKEGTSSTYKYSSATHGFGSLKLYGIDTVITPMMQVGIVDNMLYFDGYAQGNGEAKAIQILASKTLEGPWDTVAIAVRPSGIYTILPYEIDLSAFAGEPYYFAFTHLGATKYSTSYIDYVRGAKLYKADYDLMANGFAGESFVKDGDETILDINLVNVGGMDVMGADYTVEIKTVDSLYYTVNGIDLMVNEEAILNFAATFATADSLELYYEIVMDGELRIDNNMSNSIQVIVDTLFVTDGETTGQDGNTIAMNRTSAISEMIYYPSEIGSYGNLQGIEFTYNYDYPEGNDTVPAIFYIATLADSLLVDTIGWNGYASDPSWIETDSIAFTKVFDDMLDIQPGKGNSLYIPFDAPFAYNGTDNIILMIVKDSLNVGYKNLNIDKMASEHYRYAYGYNNDNRIDTDSIVVRWDGSISKSSVPNVRWHFDNPGAPVFKSEPVTSVNEFADYTYDVEVDFVPSANPFTIEAAILPSWLTLTDNGDKTATLTATAIDTVGIFSVQLVVSDGTFSATQTFEVVVNAVPVFVSEVDTLTLVNEAYEYVAEVTYNGEGFVALTGGNDNPTWLTVTDNGNNTATVAGTPDAVGDFDITIIATGEVITEQVYTLTVDATPVFEAMDDVVIEEGNDYSATITVDNADAAITAGDNHNSDITITDNGDGTATVAGTALTVGNYVVNVIADNGNYSSEMSYTVIAGAVPEYTSTPITEVNTTDVYNYDVAVSYTGDDNLVLSADVPAWLTFADNGDGTANITGTATEEGVYSVSILATGKYFNATQTYSITVSNIVTVPTDLTVTVVADSAVVAWSGSADSYNVYVNGEMVANVTEATYTLADLADGYYAIGVSGLFGDVESDKAIVDFVITDVNEAILNSFNIYPNPASSFVMVTNAENTTIDIRDITGKLMFTKQIVSGNERIDVSELNKGIYIVSMTNNSGIVSKRMVIE